MKDCFWSPFLSVLDVQGCLNSSCFLALGQGNTMGLYLKYCYKNTSRTCYSLFQLGQHSMFWWHQSCNLQSLHALVNISTGRLLFRACPFSSPTTEACEAVELLTLVKLPNLCFMGYGFELMSLVTKHTHLAININLIWVRSLRCSTPHRQP